MSALQVAALAIYSLLGIASLLIAGRALRLASAARKDATTAIGSSADARLLADAASRAVQRPLLHPVPGADPQIDQQAARVMETIRRRQGGATR